MKCITLNLQSFSIDDRIVEIKTIEKNLQHQKALWKSSDSQSLVLLCGQWLWNYAVIHLLERRDCSEYSHTA